LPIRGGGSNGQLRIDVARALESLPDIYCEVILLRDMEQLTIAEAAERLHHSRSMQEPYSSRPGASTRVPARR
jgi:RNA polymerase sigma-70 factor (ECF subfamily)